MEQSFSYPNNVKKETRYIADVTAHFEKLIKKPIGAHRDNYQAIK